MARKAPRRTAERIRETALALFNRYGEPAVSITQIAAELGISRRTVEAHRESLMRKLQIHSVAGLTRFALEAGVVADT